MLCLQMYFKKKTEEWTNGPLHFNLRKYIFVMQNLLTDTHDKMQQYSNIQGSTSEKH